MNKRKQVEHDKNLLKSIGSYSSIAKQLGISQQRISNWNRRGIPMAVKLKYPDLFLNSSPENGVE